MTLSHFRYTVRTRTGQLRYPYVCMYVGIDEWGALVDK